MAGDVVWWLASTVHERFRRGDSVKHARFTAENQEAWTSHVRASTEGGPTRLPPAHATATAATDPLQISSTHHSTRGGPHWSFWRSPSFMTMAMFCCRVSPCRVVVLFPTPHEKTYALELLEGR